MTAPIIGITTSHDTYDNGSSFRNHVPDLYVQGVARAGGLPVLIPVGCPVERLPELRAHLDGLLLTGGDDIDPVLFGAQPNPKAEGIDAGRDELEIALVRLAVDTKLPFFAICRGIQMMNVALGGTLYVDIEDEMPGAMKHGLWGVYPRDYPSHEVTLSEGSLLASVVGVAKAGVNSFHHQGVLKPAPGLACTAFAPDGLIEGLELPGHPFAVGVQWHPECMPDDEKMRALFDAFIAAARES